MEISCEKFHNTLPPVITCNPREKIDYDKVSLSSIKRPGKEKSYQKNKILYLTPEKPIEAQHLRPLAITWSPNILCFEIRDREVIKEIWLWNNCSRSIYLHCCGLWDADDKARLGAGWRCYPRTRFRMAPGLISKLFIQAKPRQHIPVPSAFVRLQLAAAYMRDRVTGFFVIPIHIKFLNYIAPYLGECE